MTNYKVRTQHVNGAFGRAFIVPVDIEANDAQEAAEQRFDILSPRESERCSALLVERGDEAYVFNVKAETVRKIVPA